MADLTNRDKPILSIEPSWWRYPGATESVIREMAGLSATYYQVRGRLPDERAALAHDPSVAKRLGRSWGTRTRTGTPLSRPER